MRPIQRCSVCSSLAQYSYYGAIVCDSCRTFFRRQVIDKKKYVCTNGSNCVIIPATRRSKTCGFCRFQKCLSVGMKPAMVEHNIRKLPKKDHYNRFYEKVKAYDSFFCNRFQEESSDAFDRKETSDGDSKSSDDEIRRLCKSNSNCSKFPVTRGTKTYSFGCFQKCLSIGMKTWMVEHDVGHQPVEYRQKQYYETIQDKEQDVKPKSDECNKLCQVSCLSPISFPVLSFKEPVLWIKELYANQMPSELLKFQVVDGEFSVCDFFQLKIDIRFDPESDIDKRLLQTILMSSDNIQLENLQEITPLSSSLFLQTNECQFTFVRDLSPIFNIYVSTISREESSIIIMESLTEDHWLRLQDVITFSKILNQFKSVKHEIVPNSLKYISQELNQLQYTCVLYTSVDRGCNIISKAIESLSFFSELSIEDQFIILKDSFFPIDCLIFNHIYEDEVESYVSSALNGMLSFCAHKDRHHRQAENACSIELDEFYDSFRDTFFEFLRKDFFVICVLSILCVLEDKPGLSHTDVFEKETRLYCEILDAYIKGKVISNEWPMETDIIRQNIERIFRELWRYSTIFMQCIREKERSKGCLQFEHTEL